MSLPAGFQLGVELTNFVGPLASTALRVGTLAAREAIQRSGSDELTELKLSHILGRLRLDAALSTHFRNIVAPTKGLTALSRFIRDVVLESGPGPTVSQALASDNPALLSMVVQLSFLTWSHDLQDLGQAIAQVVNEALLESHGMITHGLNYVALLGTMAACQQQTAAFSWEAHYKTVEDKFLRSLSAESGHLFPALTCRGIPFVVLSALLRFLEPIQRLPKEYLLELTCDEGISSVVVWCYYLLGLSVAVKVERKYICFGDEPYHITVKATSSFDEVSAVLLRRASPSGPLFTLQKTDLDPYIDSDERIGARGFLRAALMSLGVGTDNMVQIGAWVVSECQKLLLPEPGHPSLSTGADRGGVDGKSVSPDQGQLTGLRSGVRLGPPNDELGDEVLPAASFLFDTDLEPAHCGQPSSCYSLPNTPGMAWECVIELIYAFARIKNRDESGSLPLSLNTFRQFVTSRAFAQEICQVDGRFEGRPPNTIRCFEILCRLLLGPRYSEQDFADSFLVSDRGWSIFFGTMDAMDPAEISSGRLHVKLGVPAGDGRRKSRIVDGMGDFIQLHLSKRNAMDIDSDLSFWPGIWTSKLIGTHIGHGGQDAFTVVQLFGWGERSEVKKERLGFRKKQELAMAFQVLAKCGCRTGGEWSDSGVRHAVDRLLWGSSGINAGFVVEHPQPGSDLTRTPERVFRRGETWFFFVTNSAAARWLALDAFDQYKENRGRVVRPRFIRGLGCCVQCAIDWAPSPGLVLL